MNVTQLMRGPAVALSLLLSGCTPSSNEAPPLENGVYVARGICFGEGDCNRFWRTSAPVQLRERLDPASPIVATLTPGEWVEPIDGQLRLIPLRGVVNRDTEKPPLAVGDLVYMLEPLGEGFYVLWHKGHALEHDWASGDENEPITWDKKTDAAPAGAILGWWVQLKRESGQSGWVNDPSFECMGSLAGDTNCRD
jgi:hypothetical protein